MRRITVDPVLDIESMEWLPRPSFFLADDEIPIRLDRSIQKSSKQMANNDEGEAGHSEANANDERASLIPGLERQANNPTGFDPNTINNMTTAGAQAIGGVNAGITGDAKLNAGRTGNAGGYAGALDEAARIKGRQLSANAIGVQNESAQLAQQKQMEAQRQLAGLYGTDTSNALKSMGLSNDAIQNELAAGKQGWLQNTEGVLDTLSQGAQGAAGVKKAWG